MAAPEFSKEERAAMKERAKELKAAQNRDDALADVLSTFAGMADDDRAIGESLHALVMRIAPTLEPKNWYGQPAYYQNGKVVLFFQAAGKFTTRYCTLGFSENAQLDDGVMWPTSFALTAWNGEVESSITGLVKKAVG